MESTQNHKNIPEVFDLFGYLDSHRHDAIFCIKTKRRHVQFDPQA